MLETHKTVNSTVSQIFETVSFHTKQFFNLPQSWTYNLTHLVFSNHEQVTRWVQVLRCPVDRWPGWWRSTWGVPHWGAGMIGYGYKQWACITLNLMEGSDRNNLAATCKNVLRCIYRSREELVHCCTIFLWDLGCEMITKEIQSTMKESCATS